MKKKIIAAVAVAVFGIMVSVFWLPITNTIANTDFFSSGGDPDTPGFLAEASEQYSREEFILKRNADIERRRGIVEGKFFDPQLRSDAVEKLEKQKEIQKNSPITDGSEAVLAAWTPIGPAPIPNGQTDTNSVPVSGRTTAIAVHPTNPNLVYVGTASGGVYRTTDGGTNWMQIFASAQTLAIGAIAIAPSNPEIVYVGTGEPNGGNTFFGVGLYRIDNAGTTANLTGPLNKDAANNDVFTGNSISRIAVNPTNPDMIFVGTTTGRRGFRSIFFPNAPVEGVYRSTNATGAAPIFNRITSGATDTTDISILDVVIDPLNPDLLVYSSLSDNVGLFRTTNATAATPTFTKTLDLKDATNRRSEQTAELAVQHTVAQNPAIFYAAAGKGKGTIYRSADGGATWTIQVNNQFCQDQCFYDIAVAVDPSDAANVYIGGQSNIIFAKSTDSGASFTTNNVNLHADSQVLTVAPSNSNTIYFGNDGGIFKSIDAGANFTSLNNTQFSATQFISIAVHPFDPNFTIGGTQDNGTNFYQTNATWTRVDGGDGGFAQIDQNAPDTTNVRMYHTYFNVTGLQGYGTVSNVAAALAQNWTFRGCQAAGTTGNGISCNGAVNFYAPLERGPGNPNTIYYGSDRLYRSDDTGATNTVVSQNPIVAGVPISSIGISPQDDNVRIVGLNNGGLYGTSTPGATTLADLDPANAVPNDPINRSIIDPRSKTTAWVTLSTYTNPGVWKTTNVNNPAPSGTEAAAAPTWTNASGTGGANPLPKVPINAIVIDPLDSNRVYVGTEIGVYMTADGGANWSVFGTGLPVVPTFDMEITNADPRMVRIATHGLGMFQIPAAAAATAASVSISGRVLSRRGKGVSNARIILTDQNGGTRTVRTSRRGDYRFDDIEAGQTYIFNVFSKQYQFSQQVVFVTEDLNEFDLIADN